MCGGGGGGGGGGHFYCDYLTAATEGIKKCSCHYED